MATLAVAVAVNTGIDLVGVACASGGDIFPNSGQECIDIFNGDSGSHNVTIVSQETIEGRAIAALTVAIAAGVTKRIGPFRPGIYNDVDGNVHLTYSAVTSQTIKVVKQTPA